MIVSKEKFIELYELNNEADNFDYKKEIHLNTKKEKFNLIKDFLSFSNYGGGYILIGVDESDNSLVSVKKKIDPATLGDIIESNLGFNIKFIINYFNTGKSNNTLIGLIYIFPSKIVLTSPKSFQIDNKTIIGINDILTRRNTKSTKANSEDLENIFKRINLNSYENYKNRASEKTGSYGEVENLWAVLKNKVEFNLEQTSLNVNTLLSYSKFNKSDFIKFVGIESNKFETIINGETLPTLDELFRIAKLSDIDISFFFNPNIYGSPPFWKSDLIRFTILKRVNHISEISKIKDLDAFFGKIVYETAKNINNLHSLLIKGENNDILKEIPENKKNEFTSELSLQYYKVLEQVYDNEKSHFTNYERTILLWQHSNQDYLSRIFTESIKDITINNKDEFNIKFLFWEEIKNKEIKGRKYNEIDKEMIFGKIKIKI